MRAKTTATMRSGGKASKVLYRFTTLSSLLQTITINKIVLLDPSKWPDKNDSFCIDRYKNRLNLTKLYALCFTEETETHHHWMSQSGRDEVVRIRFDLAILKSSVSKVAQAKIGKVIYVNMTTNSTSIFEDDSLPFLKRYAYRQENEHRIILSLDANNETLLPEISLDDGAITGITLSPFLDLGRFRVLKELLDRILNDDRVTISKTGMLDSKKWRSYILKRNA